MRDKVFRLIFTASIISNTNIVTLLDIRDVKGQNIIHNFIIDFRICIRYEVT